MNSVTTVFFRLVGAVAVSCVAFVACGDIDEKPVGDGGSNEAAPAEPCAPATVTECPNPPLRYSNVAPIFGRKCVVCHAGVPGGEWPLTMYQHVKDWEGDVRLHLQSCSMPPPDAAPQTTKEEQIAILTWIRCGALE
jgi:hypothetical protein